MLIGYIYNTTEILRDFNGWCWDKTYDKNFDYIDNLVYQNLLIILGTRFLLEWRCYNLTNKNFLGEAKRFVREHTQNDKYFNYLFKLLLLKNEKKSKKYLKRAIINCQKEFLYFLEKKVIKLEKREELIDVLYELRYYRLLKISEDVLISDIEELDEYIDNIMKYCVTKLCKIGAINIVSMDINLNFEIIKYALNTKIIDLEKIKLFFDVDDKGLIIRVFDKDVFEKQGRKKLEITNDILAVRKRKKIKLFN